MSVHFQHLAELKTLLETKKLTNDGILELDNYKERSEVYMCIHTYMYSIVCMKTKSTSPPEVLVRHYSDTLNP